MTKSETVKALSDSPQAHEQHQQIQTTRDFQNRVGELAELLTSATYRLKQTTDEAGASIDKASQRQLQLQRNQLTIQKRQKSAQDQQQIQIDQLAKMQREREEAATQQQQRVPWLMLAAAGIGALTASLTTFGITWLLM